MAAAVRADPNFVNCSLTSAKVLCELIAIIFYKSGRPRLTKNPDPPELATS